MTPYEKIFACYKENRPEVDFSKLVGWYLQFGFVFSRPDLFVMGRAISKPPGEMNCWFIEAFSGDLRKIWCLMPHPLGWVAFTRITDKSGELTFVEMERMKRICPSDDSIIPNEAVA